VRILAAIFAIIISIFAYMGIANMAYYDCKIGAALRYREILDRIAAIGWGNYILWWIVLMLINNSCRIYHWYSWRNSVILCLRFPGLFIGI